MKTRRAFHSLGVAVLLLSLIGCRSGPIDHFTDHARTVLLTSGPSVIALSSSKVPGYWAREVGGEQEFFLYTRDRSYEKGSRVKVEGPYGGAYVSVYRDESGVYLRGYPTLIFVVWKMARADDQDDRRPASQEVTDRAPRP